MGSGFPRLWMVDSDNSRRFPTFHLKIRADFTEFTKWCKQQAQIFKQLRLISFHKKQIIPSSLTKRQAQASLTIQGISCQDFAFPVDVLDEAGSHREFTLLFLCFLLLLLFSPVSSLLGSTSVFSTCPWVSTIPV